MIVFVDGGHAPALRDARDFKSFKCLADPPLTSGDDLARALDSIGGAVTADHAWIPIDWLRRQPDLEADADWARQLQGMLDYAAGKGWVDAARGLVRAHIEWTDVAADGR